MLQGLYSPRNRIEKMDSSSYKNILGISKGAVGKRQSLRQP